MYLARKNIRLYLSVFLKTVLQSEPREGLAVRKVKVVPSS